MVTSNGILVKRLSTSDLAMIQLVSKSTTSSANNSWTLNSLTVKCNKIKTSITKSIKKAHFKFLAKQLRIQREK